MEWYMIELESNKAKVIKRQYFEKIWSIAFELRRLEHTSKWVRRLWTPHNGQYFEYEYKYLELESGVRNLKEKTVDH